MGCSRRQRFHDIAGNDTRRKRGGGQSRDVMKIALPNALRHTFAPIRQESYARGVEVEFEPAHQGLTLSRQPIWGLIALQTKACNLAQSNVRSLRRDFSAASMSVSSLAAPGLASMSSRQWQNALPPIWG